MSDCPMDTYGHLMDIMDTLDGHNFLSFLSKRKMDTMIYIMDTYGHLYIQFIRTRNIKKSSKKVMDPYGSHN
jgi:hypothetical protein